MYIFNRLAGFTESRIKNSKVPPVTLARQRYPRPSDKQLASTLSSSNAIGFLIARNPYERLISAYRDKIVGAYVNSYHDVMGKEILMILIMLITQACSLMTTTQYEKYNRYIHLLFQAFGFDDINHFHNIV